MAKAGGNTKLSAAASLANLLPTGTVLAFQALLHSISNSGSCLLAHKYLTLSVIIGFSVVCFLSSFTDSYVSDSGKVYYGIARCSDIYFFNHDEEKAYTNHDEEKGDTNHDGKKAVQGGDHDQNKENNQAGQKKAGNGIISTEASWEYRIRPRDIMHAFCSLLVFWVFATNEPYVKSCFFPHATPNENALMTNLPLTVGSAVSFLFMLFPTKRRGIGFADSVASKK